MRPHFYARGLGVVRGPAPYPALGEAGNRSGWTGRPRRRISSQICELRSGSAAKEHDKFTFKNDTCQCR